MIQKMKYSVVDSLWCDLLDLLMFEQENDIRNWFVCFKDYYPDIVHTLQGILY